MGFLTKWKDYVLLSFCVALTDFRPMLPFYNPLKISENLCFSDIFRGYRMETLAGNGLIYISC